MENMIVKGSETPITPEMIAALAAEAEDGYDLARATKVRVGRPALGKGTTPSPRFSFRVEPRLYCAARDRAAAEGRSVSDLAREAIARYLYG